MNEHSFSICAWLRAGVGLGLGLGLLGCSGQKDDAAISAAGGAAGGSAAASGANGASDSSGSSGAAACDSQSGPVDPTSWIDDFEDNDSQLLPVGGRNGVWWLTTDMSGGTIAPPGDQSPLPERILGGRCNSRYAMRFKGQGFTGWGVMLGAYLRYTTDLASSDATSFRGMKFWARAGETNVSPVRVQFEDANTSPQGGLCNPVSGSADACYNGFGTTLAPFGTEWRQYQVEFSRMTQRAFGLRRDALDPSTLYAVEFVVEPNTVFDVWVDDLTFFD